MAGEERGDASPWRHLEVLVTPHPRPVLLVRLLPVQVIIIFLCSGIGLKTKVLVDAAAAWRLHLVRPSTRLLSTAPQLPHCPACHLS